VKKRAFILIALSILVVAGMATSNVRPVHAAPVYAVNLDANSSSLTDFTVEASASDVHTFRVGAVINASSANPLLNVQGWQFQIDYNASAFVPRADPDPAATPGNPSGLYVDGAANTVLFGANPNIVNNAGVIENWNGLIAAGTAFPAITISTSGSAGSILVGASILAGGSQVRITGPNLLANVGFELINKPGTAQSFKISSVLFVDNAANPIPGVSAGSGADETVTNDPPHARFTARPASTLGPLAYSFDATTSFDDDSIPATGYSWDFGDNNQTVSSVPVLTHVFPAIGIYNVTLRVVDSLGATGSARDSLGGVVVNLQPSHIYISLNVVPSYPDFTITANPKSIGYAPGSTSTSTIAFSSINGLSGDITLTAVATPSVANGPQLSFNPTGLTLKSYGSNSSILSAAFAANSPILGYNVTVTATMGSISHSATLTLIPGTIRVQPALVTGVNTGATFTVKVAASAAGLYGWQFTLNYDPSILSTTPRSLTLGSFWQSAFRTNQGTAIVHLNQTAGTLLVVFTLIGENIPTFSGNDTLVSVLFTANSNGLSSLNLSDVIFIDAHARGIPISLQRDGTFDNRIVHDVAITSVVALPATVKLGDTVTITVGVKNKGLDPETVTVSLSAGGASIGQQQVSLNPGDSTTLTFHWNTTGITPGTVTIKAMAAISTGGNTSDNTLSTTVTVNAPPVVQPTSSVPYVLYGGVGAAVAAILAVVTLLFLRRRRTSAATL
jgi:hypothetical protein